MKKTLCKILSVGMCAALSVTMAVPAFAGKGVDYKISNPYASVENLLGNPDNHYKTNLHTHSTLSDADTDFSDMIKEHYNQDFDILGFADHGVMGRYWNEKQVELPIYLYQKIIGNKVTKLTDDEYNGITGGTYPSEENRRTKSRGMQCVPQGIELNMVTMTKSHVNGYFCDFGENDIGFENGYEYAVKHVDKAGGISVINHPGDWIGSSTNYNKARDIKYVRLFGDILNKYESCQGIEVLNGKDKVTKADRILWDELLQYVIPHGKRTVWGFGNSDAHNFGEIDTSFMDFILPEYSLENVKSTMMNGNFFAIGRRARIELGDDFKGTGAYPTVTSIHVDEKNDTITVTGKDAYVIQWIANGNIIEQSTEKNSKGEIVSTIKLREHVNDITCYVRFQLLGNGGICCAQPFTCDDGNMASYIIEDTRTQAQKNWDAFFYNIKSLRFFTLFEVLYKKIF